MTEGPEAEPSLTIVPHLTASDAPNRLVLAYMDWAQHGGDGNIAGISTSDDYGQNWTRRDRVPLGACNAGNQCVVGAGGDPWLTRAGGSWLYHVSIAALSDGTRSALVSESVNGGETWAAQTIVGSEPNLDKPTIDERDGAAMVTYWVGVMAPGTNTQVDARIAISSNADGTWESPTYVRNADGSDFLRPEGEIKSFRNPIIRVVDASRAYLFLQDPETPHESPYPTIDSPFTDTYNVYRVWRDSTTSPWKARRIFSKAGTHFAVYYGARPVGAPEPERRTFRNRINADFEMEPVPTGQYSLWMAVSVLLNTERERPGIRVVNCVDDFVSDPPACGEEGNGWVARSFGNMEVTLPLLMSSGSFTIDTDGEADQIMPDLTLIPTSSKPKVRLSWFRYGVGLQPYAMRREGVRSETGDSWTMVPTIISLPYIGARELCATPSADPSSGWIGDYAASVALPTSAYGEDRVVTAFPYTRGPCQEAANEWLAEDLHVEASVW